MLGCVAGWHMTVEGAKTVPLDVHRDDVKRRLFWRPQLSYASQSHSHTAHDMYTGTEKRYS